MLKTGIQNRNSHVIRLPLIATVGLRKIIRIPLHRFECEVVNAIPVLEILDGNQRIGGTQVSKYVLVKLIISRPLESFSKLGVKISISRTMKRRTYVLRPCIRPLINARCIKLQMKSFFIFLSISPTSGSIAV